MIVGVIGANSFLAQRLIRELAGEHELLLFSRTRPVEPLEGGIEWIQSDLRSDSIVACVNRCLSADVVVYCVAGGVQPGHQDSTDQIWFANTFAPIEICEQLEERGFRGTIVTFGSYFEFGSSLDVGVFDELDLVMSSRPLPNAYCVSKRLFTQYTVLKTSSGARTRHFHFILTNVYGFGENGRRLLPQIMSQVAAGKPSHFSSGSQIRQYTHVRDIATWLAGFISHQRTESPGGVYNLSCDAQVSVREVIELTLDMLRRRGFSVPDPVYGSVTREDSAMPCLGVDSQRARTALGWNPVISFEEGVSEYIDALITQGAES